MDGFVSTALQKRGVFPSVNINSPADFNALAQSNKGTINRQLQYESVAEMMQSAHYAANGKAIGKSFYGKSERKGMKSAT